MVVGNMDQEKQKKEPKPDQKDVLLSWIAPARPFKKRDKTYYQTSGALTFLLIAILLFIKEWLLIALVLALFFVAYGLSSIEPPKIKVQITKKGLWMEDEFYKFLEMTEYWFEKRLEQKVLVLILPMKPSGRVDVVIDETLQERIDNVLCEKLIFREKPLKTFVDKASSWLSSKVPLEDERRTVAPPQAS